MNSHALIKVDTRQSWLERALGARGSRLLLATGGTAAVVLSIPSPLIEQFATSSGLSEISRLFEPPIGVGTRILLAGGLALVPAAIVWALWAPRPAPAPAAEEDFDFGYVPTAEQAAPGRPDNDDIGDSGEMVQARKQGSGSGWGAIIRLVRGGAHDNGEGPDASLSRRRRDRHPDAPPRPPLFASRDLPPHDGRSVASALAQPEFAGDSAPDDAPRSFADAVTLAQPGHAAPVAPPPRSPDPMSDDEIARVIADMPRSPAPVGLEEASAVASAIPAYKAVPASAPRVSSQAVSPPRARAVAQLLRDIELPLIEGADLAALAARFERGLNKREIIVHAEEAQHSLDSRIAFVQPDPSVRAALRAQRPVDVVSVSVSDARGEPAARPPADPEPMLHLDEDVEHALNSALATLRKLTEQGRR